MDRPIIQTNESGKQVITALVDIARKNVPLQEVASVMSILGFVTPIPPQSEADGDAGPEQVVINPAEV